ncbi:hypothetical protein GQ53DRAFT_400158 [Thozetella sp. PMI_491]|nr:hypothetical protein GQ53DRAFT_400158 [Thozetella sp. PMI_491]
MTANARSRRTKSRAPITSAIVYSERRRTQDRRGCGVDACHIISLRIPAATLDNAGDERDTRISYFKILPMSSRLHLRTPSCQQPAGFLLFGCDHHRDEHHSISGVGAWPTPSVGRNEKMVGGEGGASCEREACHWQMVTLAYLLPYALLLSLSAPLYPSLFCYSRQPTGPTYPLRNPVRRAVGRTIYRSAGAWALWEGRIFCELRASCAAILTSTSYMERLPT